MPRTIAGAFDQLRSNLEITGLQQATVSTRQQSVRDAVARRLTVKESFLTGSYRRHTMIAPLGEADIDLFVVLDASYYSVDGYAQVLDKVRSALLETYPKTPRISRNGQAVTITFTDFVVDVVPAFYRKGGGFLIPSTTEQAWISTNPKDHETFISSANTAHQGDLVPLIKMMKAWNRQINGAFRSFYLELLIERALRGITINDFPSGCRFVLDKGRELVKLKMIDPSDLGDQVAGLAGAHTVADAVSRFETAYSRAIRAEGLAQDGDIAGAFSEWRKVFGDYSPSYT